MTSGLTTIFIFLIFQFILTAQIPDDATMWENLGDKEMGKGNYQQAHTFYETSLRHGGDTTALFYKIGSAKKATKDYSEAVWYFEESIKMDNHHYDARAALCLTQALAGEAEKSLKVCNRLLQDRPQDEYALINRSKVWMILEQTERAIADLAYLISFNPDNYKAVLLLGLAKYEEGKYTTAFDYFNLLVTINKKGHFAYHNRGMALKAMGENQSAMDDFNLVIEQMPDFAPSLHNRGLLKLSGGKVESGCIDLRKAVQLDSEILLTEEIKDLCGGFE